MIAVDGVNVTTTDEKGVYYINFNTFPSEHTIQASAREYIFDPLTVTVTEEMR